MFELHPQLKSDTLVIGQFKLSLVLLHKDANYPWVILVPKRVNIREIHHLSLEDQVQLIKESSHLSEVMTSVFAPAKMNVAALGNIVPQLHLHHVARYKDDPAWPKPVWGAAAAKAYTEELLQKRLGRLHASLIGEDFTASEGVVESQSGEGFTP